MPIKKADIVHEMITGSVFCFASQADDGKFIDVTFYFLFHVGPFPNTNCNCAAFFTIS